MYAIFFSAVRPGPLPQLHLRPGAAPVADPGPGQGAAAAQRGHARQAQGGPVIRVRGKNYNFLLFFETFVLRVHAHISFVLAVGSVASEIDARLTPIAT